MEFWSFSCSESMRVVDHDQRKQSQTIKTCHLYCSKASCLCLYLFCFFLKMFLDQSFHNENLMTRFLKHARCMAWMITEGNETEYEHATSWGLDSLFLVAIDFVGHSVARWGCVSRRFSSISMFSVNISTKIQNLEFWTRRKKTEEISS